MYKDLDIQLYYLKKKVFDLNELKLNKDLYTSNIFFNTKDFINFVKKHRDEYIDGNIFNMDGILTIKYKNKEIIPFECWDDITSLLSYFLNALEECIYSKTSEFFYPEQPLNVKLDLEGKNIDFTFEENTYRINKELFFNSFLEISQLYFELIQNEFGLESYSYELSQINKLRNL